MARKSTEFVSSLRKFQNRNNVATTASADENIPVSPSISLSSSQAPTNNSALKSRYIAQNQTLAKTNSLMSSKINDLECRLNQLLDENKELRQISSKHARDKNQLIHKINSIETELVRNFNHIFQNLQSIRRDFNASPSNFDTNTLFDLSHLLLNTSTPTDDGPFYLPTPLVPSSRPKSASSPPIESQAMNALEQAGDNKKKPETFQDVSVILEEDESNTSQTDLGKPQHKTKEPAENKEVEHKELKDKDLVPTSNAFKSHTTTKRSSSKTKPSSNVNARQEIESIKDSTETKSTKTKQSQKTSNAPLRKPISPVKVEIFDDKSKDVVPNRPRRNTKKIDYKPVPLGAKLRRESPALVDAMDENAFKFVVSEKKQVKKRRLSHSQPLSNITHMENQNSSRKELDIFDFENETDKRPMRNRRYTMNT